MCVHIVRHFIIRWRFHVDEEFIIDDNLHWKWDYKMHNHVSLCFYSTDVTFIFKLEAIVLVVWRRWAYYFLCIARSVSVAPLIFVMYSHHIIVSLLACRLIFYLLLVWLDENIHLGSNSRWLSSTSRRRGCNVLPFDMPGNTSNWHGILQKLCHITATTGQYRNIWLNTWLLPLSSRTRPL